MPNAMILVGVPGCGKSTWINSHLDEELEVVISIDNILEGIAKEKGTTYNGVFRDHVNEATKLANAQAREAIAAKKNIIWDMTNTTAKSRARKLNMLTKDYVAWAIIFPTPSMEELERRLASRPGKTISKEVLDQMISRLEEPTFEEGFTYLRVVDHDWQKYARSDISAQTKAKIESPAEFVA
jgi:predicted kinase